MARGVRRVTYRIREPDAAKRAARGVFSPRNCPKATYTGDGVPLGRCDHWLGEDGNTCPVHGDVSGEEWMLIKTVRLTAPQMVLLREVQEAEREGKTLHVENRRRRTVDVLVREKLLKIVHQDGWSTWIETVKP